MQLLGTYPDLLNPIFGGQGSEIGVFASSPGVLMHTCLENPKSSRWWVHTDLSKC